MQNTNPQIAIIGAGLSGAVLSNRLVKAGFSVSAYDKSRGTGGRLSSCRINNASADLGAPFFDTTSAEFISWMQSQAKVCKWNPKHFDFNRSPKRSSDVYLIEPRQSALTRALLEGAEFIPQCRVGYIWPEKENGQNRMILRDEHGKALGTYDAVIVTAPAAQAEALLEAVPRFAKRAQEVEHSMNWVVVVQTSSTAVSEELFTGEHPVLQRCIKDSAKPGRQAPDGSEVWFLEANPHWSKTHQESDSETVFAELMAAFSSVIDADPEILSYRAHRWLYSGHQSNEQVFLWDAELGLGAAGDWLQGYGLEGAWRSANRLADQMIDYFQDRLV